MKAVLLACLALLPSAARADDSVHYTNAICWKEPRIYHPGGTHGAELESAAKGVLRLTRLRKPLPHPRTLSPNRAYAFHHEERARPEPPSGSTDVSLLVFTEKDQLLSVSADGVQSLQDARWVNEKLVSFRLWLSRLGGVDVLIDVEREQIARMEAFSDGRLLWEQARASCQAVPRIPACDQACPTIEGPAVFPEKR